MSQLVIVSESAPLARQAAQWLGTEAATAIAERGACAICLAGGRTPEPVYRALASDPRLDWRRVSVFFGDERAVPPDHPDSNYLMVHRALLSRVPIPAGQAHRMEAERADRDAAALEYDRLLPERLDVLFLGIGADGHTASLFPGSAALDERRRRVVPVIAATKPAERLTITPPVIQAARRVAVIAAGGEKAPVVARAIEGAADLKAVPAQLARRGVWFLDGASAAGLTARSMQR